MDLFASARTRLRPTKDEFPPHRVSELQTQDLGAGHRNRAWSDRTPRYLRYLSQASPGCRIASLPPFRGSCSFAYRFTDPRERDGLVLGAKGWFAKLRRRAVGRSPSVHSAPRWGSGKSLIGYCAFSTMD